MYPSDYTREKGKVESAANLAAIIKDAFYKHEKYLKERSAEPDEIGAKLLVKCASVSAEQNGMWAIFNELRNVEGIDIFAGASESYEKDPTGTKHYKNEEPIKEREEYLSALHDMDSKSSAIVLHFDILSEGIDVAGFTGVLFISGTLPSNPKVLQNIGRSTRLHPLDRQRFLKGEINTADKSTWVKPFCSAIIPYWDSNSEETKNDLMSLIKELRKLDFELEPTESGNDDPDGSEDFDERKNLNKEDSKVKRKSVEDLIHEIEELEFIEKINDQSPIEFFYEINGINKEEVEKWYEENK